MDNATIYENLAKAAEAASAKYNSAVRGGSTAETIEAARLAFIAAERARFDYRWRP